MAQMTDDLKMVHEEEMTNYDRIERAVVSVMRRHGAKIIETPTFEDYDTYGKYFPRLRREMIKTIGPSGEVLVLRPDVTVPLLKTAAREYPDPKKLLKFGYVSPVFREYYGKSTHGKYFRQSGMEVLGDATPECDGEVIAAAAEFLKAVGLSCMRIDLGTVAFMDALFDELRISEDALSQIRECLETRNLVSFQKLADSLPITRPQRDVLLALPELFGNYEETLTRAENFCLNSRMQDALERLAKVHEYLKIAGYGRCVQLDLGFTSHMGYYTDLVFRIYAKGALYSLVSGGRYDRLADEFGVPRPACGFGLNMNLLYEVLAEENLLAAPAPSCDLAIRYEKPDETLVKAILALRARGFSVMGVDGGNTIDAADYRLVIRYEKGKFLSDETVLTESQIEEILKQ